MSVESDVLMQQFRQAVYERLATPGAGRSLSPEGAIEQRSVLFRNWQSGLQAKGEMEHLAPDLVRHWAVADVTAFRNVRADRRAIAEDDIFKNISASPAYAQILSSVDVKLFEQVKAAAAVNEQKIAEKLGRDVRELEQVRRERALLLEDTSEAQKRREELLPSDWNGKIVVETIKDPLGDLIDVRAERKGDAGSQHLAFVDTAEQAKALTARYEAIAKHWTVPKDQQEAGFSAGDAPVHKPADPESVISKVLENATYKTRSDGSVLYMVNDRPAFVDHGQQILMESKAKEDEEAILAAVLLAKEKYGGAFEVTGSDEFKRRAIEVILKHQIDVKLKNPQQDALRRELEKAGVPSPKEGAASDPTLVKPLIGKPADDAQVPPAPAGDTATPVPPGAPAAAAPSTSASAGSAAAASVPVVLEKVDLDGRRPALKEWLDSTHGRKAVADAVNALYGDQPSPGLRFDDMPKGSVFADEFGNVLEKVGDTEARVLHGVEFGATYDDAGGVEQMRAHSDETFQLLRLPKRLRLEDTPDTRFADIPVSAIFQDEHGGLWEKNGPDSAVLLRADKGGHSAGMEGHTGTWSSHVMVEVVVDSDLRAVRAIDWWTVQRAAIHLWAKTDSELKADLEQLGPEPSHNLVYWFDRSGKQRVGPADPAAFVSKPDADARTYWVDFAGRYMTREQIEDLGEDCSKYDTAENRERDADVGAPPVMDAPGFVPGADEELRARDAMGSGDSSAEIAFNVNVKELDMAAVLDSNDQDPKLVLRGVKKLESGEFDTTVLLFKGKGDYLQGFVKVGDQKHQVIAHINARKPDPETGEVKPNFLKLSEGHAAGDDMKWKEIGFGNAVNKRSDGKPVYFDEVLFSVGNEVVKARVTKDIDADMHKQLGFVEPRQARPKDKDQGAAPAGDASPKATAPAAKEKGDAAGARNPARNAAAAKQAASPKTPAPAAGENTAGPSKPRNSRPRARA